MDTFVWYFSIHKFVIALFFGRWKGHENQEESYQFIDFFFF